MVHFEDKHNNVLFMTTTRARKRRVMWIIFPQVLIIKTRNSAWHDEKNYVSVIVVRPNYSTSVPI